MITVLNTEYSAVSLLSGGLDSTLATILAQKTYGAILAITFDYGQVCAKMEIEHSKKIADYLSIENRVIKIDIYKETQWVEGGFLITGALSEDEMRYWVPNRNGVMIEIAGAVAEGIGGRVVIVGFNITEAEGFPDNTREYLDAINNAFRFSTKGRIKVISPTLNMTKSQITRMLYDMNFPIEYIYPCYIGKELLCGKCPSCTKFIKALQNVGIYNKYSWRFESAS
ncbi:MAG: 7-cyano-7-deazaguanine synthase QueC [bacterium]